MTASRHRAPATTPAPIAVNSAVEATASARRLSPAPSSREMSDAPPAPKVSPNPTKNRENGNATETAATETVPSPDTK